MRYSQLNQIQNCQLQFKKKQQNQVKLMQQASIVIIPKQRQREEIQRLEQIQKISIYQQIEDTRQMKELLKEELERQKRNEELDQEDKRRRQESVQEFEKNLQKKTFMAAEEQKLRVVEDTITSLEREQAITKAQVDQLQLWKFMEMDLIQKLNKDQTQIQKSHRFLEDSQQMPLNQFQKVYQPEKIQEVPLLQKKPKRMMLNKSHNNSILQLGENDNNLSMQEQHRTTLHITEPNQ